MPLTVLLLAPLNRPVPATQGGAIEQLVTHLIEVNEETPLLRLVVLTKGEANPTTQPYRHTTFYYLNDYRAFCRQLPAAACRFHLYRLWKRLFQNRFFVRLYGKHASRMDSFFYQCALIAAREKVDYIVNEGGYDLRQFAAMDAWFPRERVYEHLHYVRPEDISLRQCVTHSIAISRFVQQAWVKTPGLCGQNSVLYNGIDTARFSRALPASKRAEQRRALGVAETDCLVLFCGRLVPEKGVAELLDALSLLPDPHIKLCLIGEPERARADSSALFDRVRTQAERDPRLILTGFIPPDQLPAYYALADLQVIPSVAPEGAGLVAVEGMAAGLPLIVTRSGGLPEYVDNEAALLLPITPSLPAALANAIRTLAGDAALRRRMGAAGQRRSAYFTKQEFYRHFVQIFNEAESKL